jgi:hypothetical protein
MMDGEGLFWELVEAMYADPGPDRDRWRALLAEATAYAAA